jgi:hypothetical protein
VTIVTQPQGEPPDDRVYEWVSFNRDTFHFYIDAVKFYHSLLKKDRKAMLSDPDLKSILGDNQLEDLEINRELLRAQRVLDWMNDKIAKGGKDAIDYDISIAHGVVRFLKSVAILYLGHLKQRRNVLASRPNISRHALESVDRQISGLEEKIQLGIFSNATPMPLLVDQVIQSPTAAGESAQESLVTAQRPRPIVLATIEILDPELRSRCLDLFDMFQRDGQRDRLDTVISEATRILEDRVRRLSGAEATCVGQELAAYAFGTKTPRLIISDVGAEQEAAHLMYRGVFGFIRNQVHHRLTGELQPERVLQALGLIDYLIALVGGARRAGGTGA